LNVLYSDWRWADLQTWHGVLSRLDGGSLWLVLKIALVLCVARSENKENQAKEDRITVKIKRVMTFN
jgi:hypothetical protein